MSVRSLNWLKFGGLVGLAFVLGLLFAGLLDLPRTSAAQGRDRPAQVVPSAITQHSVTPPATTAPLVALSDAFAAVAEQVRPSVVYIVSKRTERQVTSSRRLPGVDRAPPGFQEFFGSPRGRNNDDPQIEQGSGSGFVVSEDGYILTNNHVVDGADEVTVKLLDRHEFKAKVVGTDPNTDIAVIKIDPGSLRLHAAALGSSTATRVGEWVLAVGNPLSSNLNFTVTSGIVSAKGRGQLPLPGSPEGTGIQDFIQTDAAINRGNSGGPLLNVRGEVIGINSAIFTQSGFSVGYAFAIPIDLAKTVMAQLITKGKVERAALGVQVRDASPLDAENAKLEEIRGVTIHEFLPHSPAEAAGLQEGDLIISIDGQPVEYTAQLQQLVGFRKPGDVVKVEVARKGGVRKTYSVRLELQQKPAQLASRTDSDEEATPERTESNSLLKERLGVTVAPVTSEIARELELPNNIRGVYVEKVDPYGPADGLLTAPPQGVDVITAIEGKPVRSEADLRAAVRAAGKGEILSFTVYQTNPNSNAQGQSRIVRVKVK